MSSRQNFEAVFKVLVVGDARCGKDALVKRFVEERFDESEDAETDGTVSMGVRAIDLVGKDGKKMATVKVKVYYPPGDQRFEHVVFRYFKEVQGIVILYDASAKDVSGVRRWLGHVKQHANWKELAIYMVGNKSDLLVSQHSAVMEDIIREFAFPTLHVSAKTGDNVDLLFSRLAHMMYQRKRMGEDWHLDDIFNLHKKGIDRSKFAALNVARSSASEMEGAGGRGADGSADGSGDGSGGGGGGGGGGGYADEPDLKSRLKGYFQGKFKRQRRRFKQKVLQTVNAADSTKDPLYISERDRYLAFDKRLRKMNDLVHNLFGSMIRAFDSGVELGDDFQYVTNTADAHMRSKTDASELIGSFTQMMSKAAKDARTLADEAARTMTDHWEEQRMVKAQSAPPPLRSGGGGGGGGGGRMNVPGSPASTMGDGGTHTSTGTGTGSDGYTETRVAYIDSIKERLEQRERSVLDFDAYRRKVREIMAKMQEKGVKDKYTVELKKREAKLLRARETFEVMNTSLLEDFHECQEQRARYMVTEFRTMLKTVMKLFHSVSRSLDDIVPLISKTPQHARVQTVGNDVSMLVRDGSGGSDGSGSGERTTAISTDDMSSHVRSRSNNPMTPVMMRPESSMQLSSNRVDMLFNPSLNPMVQQMEEERISAHIRAFHPNFPFARLHELAQSSLDTELMEAHFDRVLPSANTAQQRRRKKTMHTQRRASRRASKHVLPPTPPLEPMSKPAPPPRSSRIFHTSAMPLSIPNPNTIATTITAAATSNTSSRSSSATGAGVTAKKSTASSPNKLSVISELEQRHAQIRRGIMSRQPQSSQPPATTTTTAATSTSSPYSTPPRTAPASASAAASSSSRVAATTAKLYSTPCAQSMASSSSSATVAAAAAEAADSDDNDEYLDDNEPIYEQTVVQACALYDYVGHYEGDVAFNAGDIILVYQWTEGDQRTVGWWQGYVHGEMGYFPAAYVQLLDEIDTAEPAPENSWE